MPEVVAPSSAEEDAAPARERARSGLGGEDAPHLVFSATALAWQPLVAAVGGGRED